MWQPNHTRRCNICKVDESDADVSNFGTDAKVGQDNAKEGEQVQGEGVEGENKGQLAFKELDPKELHPIAGNLAKQVGCVHVLHFEYWVETTQFESIPISTHLRCTQSIQDALKGKERRSKIISRKAVL